MSLNQATNLSSLVSYPMGTSTSTQTSPCAQAAAPCAETVAPCASKTSSCGQAATTVAVTKTDACGNVVSQTFTTTLYNQMCQKGTWVFMVIGIIAIIIVAWIAWNGRCFWNSLEKWCWGDNELVWMVVLAISILLLAWGCSVAYTSMQHANKRNMVMGGFVLLMILVVLWAILFFRKDGCEYTTCGIRPATWVAVVAAIVALLMLYPLWSSKGGARLAALPFIIVIIALAALTNNIACNLEGCDEGCEDDNKRGYNKKTSYGNGHKSSTYGSGRSGKDYQKDHESDHEEQYEENH